MRRNDGETTRWLLSKIGLHFRSMCLPGPALRFHGVVGAGGAFYTSFLMIISVLKSGPACGSSPPAPIYGSRFENDDRDSPPWLLLQSLRRRGPPSPE